MGGFRRAEVIFPQIGKISGGSQSDEGGFPSLECNWMLFMTAGVRSGS